MRKICCTILFAVTLFIYRTEVFNWLVTYEVDEKIEIQGLTDPYWTTQVDAIISSNEFEGITELNDILIRLISSKLKFGKQQVIYNPNKFRETDVAHCVGYSALHAALLDYACKKLNTEHYEVSHVRGQIKFLGFRLTSKNNDPFFVDHDFVKIENKAVDKNYFSDAALYEYLRIKRVK